MVGAVQGARRSGVIAPETTGRSSTAEIVGFVIESTSNGLAASRERMKRRSGTDLWTMET
jgi:hypothetical protein